MARKRDQASEIVEFFASGSPETVATVFGIVRGIVERRGLHKPKAKPVKARGTEREKAMTAGAHPLPAREPDMVTRG